ncbi:MAG TPA: dihydroneopterin aldolase [Actinomycetota bacterium]
MEGTDLIEVRGLKLQGRHGVTDEERADAQAIEVSLAVRLDTREAATFDDLSATLDYAEAVTQVTKIVEGESFHLIETLADHIARQILSSKRVLDVWVRVSKPDVALPVDEVAVEISRSREDIDGVDRR